MLPRYCQKLRHPDSDTSLCSLPETLRRILMYPFDFVNAQAGTLTIVHPRLGDSNLENWCVLTACIHVKACLYITSAVSHFTWAVDSSLSREQCLIRLCRQKEAIHSLFSSPETSHLSITSYRQWERKQPGRSATLRIPTHTTTVYERQQSKKNK